MPHHAIRNKVRAILRYELISKRHEMTGSAFGALMMSLFSIVMLINIVYRFEHASRSVNNLVSVLVASAAMLVLITLSCRTVHHAYRRQLAQNRLARGQCAQCGYDVDKAFDLHCPKCGASTGVRQVIRQLTREA